MSKLFSVSWSSSSLHYVFAETRKAGIIRILSAGEKVISADPTDDESETANDRIVRQLQQVASESKVGRAKLILAVSRGSVDSASFSVPPSTDAELPTLVENMAQHHLTGLGDNPTIDFVSFPPLEDGSRNVSVMALTGADSKLIDQLVEASGCMSASAVVVTHPLRTFAPKLPDGDDSAVLVVNKGLQSSHILVVQHGCPVLSRTLRLAPGASREDEAAFIAAEIQRTILTIGDHLQQDVEINNAVLVGSLSETTALAESLKGRIEAVVSQVSAADLVETESNEAGQGSYAPLIAALSEEAHHTQPAVDFLHPKRPPTQVGQRNRFLGIAAAVLLLVGGSWYYVNSLFAEVDERIAAVRPQLDEITKAVKATTGIRRQAAGLARWDASRMNWLDEIRDLTIRMPSSPELTVRQFAATPSGSGYTVTFQGTSQSPKAHRAMELGIQDEYHTTRTPSFSESGSGRNSKWNFRTTLQIRRRSRKDYKAHKTLVTGPGLSKPDTAESSSGTKNARSSKSQMQTDGATDKQNEATQS